MQDPDVTPNTQQEEESKAPAPTLKDSISSLQNLAKSDLTQTAQERIETITDLIDVICDAAEKENEEFIPEISNSTAISSLLQMAASPVQEIMKLAFSGLERLFVTEDITLAAIELGAFEILVKLLDSSSSSYAKSKASTMISLLLASDFDKGLKLLSLQNDLFSIFSTEMDEAIIRFLTVITEDFPEGQERLVTSPTAVGFLLDMIKKQQYHALGPLCNVLQLPKIKSLLPIVDIENLLKPLLNDAEIELDDESFDRVVIVLSNLIDSEKDDAITFETLIEQLQDMAFAILDGTLLICGLTPVLSGINNLAINDQNKIIIGNTEIPKILMSILQREKQPHTNSNPIEGVEDDEIDGESEDSDNNGEVKTIAAKVQRAVALNASLPYLKQAMWSLLFRESNRKRMEADGTYQVLQRLSAQEENPKVRQNLQGCLWLFKAPNKIGSTDNPKDAENGSIFINKEADKDQNNTTTSSSTSRKLDEGTSQVEIWSVEQVQQWRYGPIFAAQRIDGRALAEVAHNICDIRFLEMVEKRLEFNIFGDLMGFVHAVKKYL